MPGRLDRQRVIDLDSQTAEPAGATSAAGLYEVG